MKQKKGKFTTFIFSLIPGAAEMYMGFMKNGISLMALFFLSFIVPSVLRVSDVFVLIAGLVWFYSFFHARNLAACSEEQLQEIPDEFIWEAFVNGREIKISSPTLRKWGAIILIFYGVVLLWQTLSSIIYHLIPDHMWEYLVPVVDQIPQIAIAVFIIAIGLKLIAGKKEELNGKIEEMNGEKEKMNGEEK